MTRYNSGQNYVGRSIRHTVGEAHALPFTKMQGLGNDYVYVEELLDAPLKKASDMARRLLQPTVSESAGKLPVQ